MDYQKLLNQYITEKQNELTGRDVVSLTLFASWLNENASQQSVQADIATDDGKFCKCGWSLERHGGMNCLYRDAANANR